MVNRRFQHWNRQSPEHGFWAEHGFWEMPGLCLCIQNRLLKLHKRCLLSPMTVGLCATLCSLNNMVTHADAGASSIFYSTAEG